MAASTVEELRLDSAECSRLLALCERAATRELLQKEITRVNHQIARMESSSQEKKSASSSGPAPPAATKGYVKKVTNYAWDQSDKFVKFYVSVSGADALPEDQVTCQYTNSSFHLVVSELKGVTYDLYLPLYGKIKPSDSRIKVKRDQVVVMLRKENSANWPHVTLSDKDKEKKAKADEKPDMEDPGAGIMNMMKKMYDEGDDEMKKTIGKAWYESQQKQRAGDMGL